MLATSLAINTLPAKACGPFFKSAVFSYELHPGLPLENYAEGSLGIIRPEFARSYLIVAYRTLSDRPLSTIEKQDALAVWKSRLLFEYSSQVQDSLSDWKKARSKVNTEKIDISTYGRMGKYSNYQRLTSGALRSACETLDKVVSKYGAKSEQAKRWLAAQDIVFGKGKDLPAALPDDASQFEKDERAYQIAAFYFYRKQFDQAARLFERISKNEDSRWSKIAPYIVARCYIRKAQLGKNEDRNSNFKKAKEALEGILSDKTKSEQFAMTRSLLQFVNLRAEPESTLERLSNRIAKANSAKTFKNDLIDLTKLLDDIEYKSNSNNENKTESPKKVFKSDLADWVWTYQSIKKVSSAEVITKWKENKSIPWLLSSLASASYNVADLGDTEYEELRAAFKKVSVNSPGYLSLVYYLSKVMIEKGETQGASKLIAQALGKKGSLTPTTVNLFKDLKLQVVKDLNEAISLIPRTVAGDDYLDYDFPDWFFSTEKAKEKRPSLPRISPVVADLLNKALPLEVLSNISESASLPPVVKSNLVSALWVRAVLLDKDKQALSLSQNLQKLMPELKPDLRAYQSCKSSKKRKFLALYTALKNPGLRPYVTSGYLRETKLNKIDSFKDNWWAKGQLEYYYDSKPGAKKKVIERIAKRILTAEQVLTAEKEYGQLLELGTAPNYLAKEIIAYAKINPGDNRIPEALHRAVKATRYGSTDKQTRSYSKACFTLLHKNYKASPWTKKTPYYY